MRRRAGAALVLAASLLGPASSRSSAAPRMPWSFGGSVAALGDLDGDGVPEIAVGASSAQHCVVTEDRLETILGGTGTVFLFSGKTGSLLRSHASDAKGDGLGTSVADAGDVDGDGVRDVLAGVPFASPGEYGSRRGRTVIFSGRDGRVLHRFDGQKDDDRSGWAVAGAGDLDGDGRADVLVGAPWATPGLLSEAGVLQVFSGAAGRSLFQIPGGTEKEWLGISAATGDLDGDGTADIVAGATCFLPPAVDRAGRVLALSGKSGKPIFSVPGTRANGRLGFHLAVVEDIDGDGRRDVVAGEPGGDDEDPGRLRALSGKDGSEIYAIRGDSPGVHLGWCVAALPGRGAFAAGTPYASPGGRKAAGRVTLRGGPKGDVVRTLDGENAGDWFGQSVAGIGDLNGDGVADLLVGAEYAAARQGRVHVISGKAGSTIRVLEPSVPK